VTTDAKGQTHSRVCEGSGEPAWLMASATSVATILGQCPACARTLVCGGSITPMHVRPLLACEMADEATEALDLAEDVLP